MYYAYEKGFWQVLRGTLSSPRLAGAQLPFFVGRGCRLLFPSHLTVGRNVAIGDYVFMNCFANKGVFLGDNVRIREFGWIQVTSDLTNPGEGLWIGNDTYVGPRCVFGAGGGIRIGNHVTMGANVQLLAEDHRFDNPSAPAGRQGVRRKGISVDSGCWIGNSVIVTDGVHVGANAVIGAGAVVIADVPPASVAVGVPARVIRRI